jgi:hypothetical protein
MSETEWRSHFLSHFTQYLVEVPGAAHLSAIIIMHTHGEPRVPPHVLG